MFPSTSGAMIRFQMSMANIDNRGRGVNSAGPRWLAASPVQTHRAENQGTIRPRVPRTRMRSDEPSNTLRRNKKHWRTTLAPQKTLAKACTTSQHMSISRNSPTTTTSISSLPQSRSKVLPDVPVHGVTEMETWRHVCFA